VTAAQWVRALRLAPHREGGWYRETHRDTLLIPRRGLPRRFRGPRAASTAILFLLARGQCSRLHRIRSAEVWHFYRRSALDISIIAPDGRRRVIALGSRPARRERVHAVVPAGAWFGARLRGRGAWALVGCTVAPGFDFADLELADRATLLREFPRHRRTIEALTPLP